jgi:transposase
MHRLQEMVRLHRSGYGAREVARLLSMSPNTEREYREALTEARLLSGAPENLPSLDVLCAAVLASRPTASTPAHELSKIEPWRAMIEAHLREGLGPRAVFDRLRLEHASDFTGSYAQVKRLCRSIVRARPVLPEDVAIAVITTPGDIAQVDFGYVGRLYDPTQRTQRKAWCFVMVLAHSRRMVVRVVFDQRAETWLSLHVEAFAELGVAPHTVVPDNLKAAVIRAAFSARDSMATLHRSYVELARHYGFVVDPTPPRSPEKKGRVESGVKYVKGNFFKGRAGQNVEDVRRDLQRWTDTIANERIHGTTGQKPSVLFEADERGAMLPLPTARFEMSSWRKTTVREDAHAYDGLRGYSVPFRLIGAGVWLNMREFTVRVFDDTELVATHDRAHGPGRTTLESHLPEGRRELRHRSRAHWEERAVAIGPEVARLVAEVFDSDRALSQLPAVQQIVLLLERLPAERANAISRRASFYGATRPAAIERILERGLDREPLPTLSAAQGTLDAPRFARPFDFFRSSTRVPHETH